MWTEDAVLPSKEKIPLVILFLYIHIVCLYIIIGECPGEGISWIDRPEPGSLPTFFWLQSQELNLKPWGMNPRCYHYTTLPYRARQEHTLSCVTPLNVSSCCTSLRGVRSLVSRDKIQSPSIDSRNILYSTENLCCFRGISS